MRNERDRCRIRLKARSLGLPLATWLTLRQQKRSDVLFILGSGAGLRDLNEYQWNFIQKKDSFGFNNFAIHDHSPTFYMCEFDINHPALNDFFVQYMRRRDRVSKPSLIKDIEFNCPRNLQGGLGGARHVYLLATEFVDLNDIEKQLASITAVLSNKEGFLKKNLFPKYYQSVFTAICIGAILGYQRIVLAGIDLNSTDYFYYGEEYRNSKFNRHINYLRDLQGSIPVAPGSHYSERSLGGQTPPSAYIPALAAALGLNISLASKKSKLYPSIDIFDWSDE
jgi:hypothetical protein